MNKMKTFILISILGLSLFMSLKMHAIDLINNFYKGSEEKKITLNYTTPQQIVFEYVKLVREQNFADLEKLYTKTPISYWKLDKQKFNDRIGSPSNSELQTENTSESYTKEIISENARNSVFDNLFHDFIVKHNPDFILKKGLFINEIIENHLESEGNISRIRVSYASDDGKAAIYRQDFFLIKTSNGMWKIFNIQYP